MTTRRILFVDGVCVMCNRLTQFLAHRDSSRRLIFATLQGQTAAETFRGTPFESVRSELSGVLYARGNHLHSHSTAAILALNDIGGMWKIASILLIIPKPVRDWAYHFVARRRYRWFGKKEFSCPLPDPADNDRFLD